MRATPAVRFPELEVDSLYDKPVMVYWPMDRVCRRLLIFFRVASMASGGERAVGGLFFDFGAVRTESRDHDAPRMTWSRRWRRRDATSRRWRRHDHMRVHASRE